MFRLKLASCMAENTEELCQVLAVYLQSQLGVPTECVTDVAWQERERLFDQGEIQLLWLCGLPYVHKADLEQSRTEFLWCRFLWENDTKDSQFISPTWWSGARAHSMFSRSLRRILGLQ